VLLPKDVKVSVRGVEVGRVKEARLLEGDGAVKKIN
jgi:ABC-type transporter Mla subunit MlaD